MSERDPAGYAVLQIVKAGFGSLREIETHWSVDDLMDALEILLADAAEQALIARAAQKQGG